MAKRFEFPIICILFLTGAVGYSIMQLKDLFTFMTPIFLLVTGLYIILRGLKIGFKSSLFLIATLLATFAIEAAGVYTGRIFGDYSYGASLGIKFLNVPPIIALNWLVLILSSLSVSKAIASGRFMSAVISGMMLVFLDILIEPVAMKYDWWDWSLGIVPFQNYAAWFLIAFTFSLFLYSVMQREKTYLLKSLYFIQLAFFIIIYASLKP